MTVIESLWAESQAGKVRTASATQTLPAKVFTIYDTATGEINCVLETRSSEPPSMPGISYIEGKHEGATHLIVGGVPQAKPSVDAEFDVITGPPDTICTLSGLPIPINIQINDTDIYEITDGVLEVTMTTVGAYKIVVADYRYLRKVWNLSCL